MQFHMSSAPAPGPATGGALPQIAPGPTIVRRPKPKPRNLGPWVVLALALVAGTAYYVLTERGSQRGSGGGGISSVPMATIALGDLERTIRASGAIAAERSASLLAPQLRGRSDGGTFSGGRSRRGGGGGGSSSSSSSGGGSSRSSSGGPSTGRPPSKSTRLTRR